jgi:antirestriction protein ArdC
MEPSMKTQTEIRTSITNAIIESLNQGRIPWRKPWASIGGPRTATNFVTNRPYSGVNVILTMIAEAKHGWPVSYWATFNQLRSICCHVRKGEKATAIVFWQQIKKTVTDKNGDEQEKTIPFLKTWSVFNVVGQAEGEAIEKFRTQPVLKTFDVDRTEFDVAVSATQARIDHGNEIAAYLPLEDRIIMPDVGRFDSFPEYAATTLHELSHWAQPKHRLGIEGTYAENELFAEISSSYLMAALGIPHADDLRNTKAYIQSWLKSVGDDPKAIFKASSLASKAADYLLAFSRPAEEADVETEAEAVLA